MSQDSRQRLQRLMRRHDADLAEAALLCCVEEEPELDVDVALLRLDALADRLRTERALTGDPDSDAVELVAFLAGDQGYRGDTDSYHDPANALLTRVVERRRGLPITLTILYVAVARRVGIPAYAVHLPGHVVTAIAAGDRPIVLDPFHAGIRMDEVDLAARVAATTDGRLEFRRSMLRPAPAANVIRRLLNNLTRDLSTEGRPGAALWTVELKLLLPNRLPADHRAHGQLLSELGRFDQAAAAFETYLDLVGPEAHDAEEVRRAAIAARARLN
jgi:regulator of sirC expression with transglutaminase-like and TPR domain